MHSLPSPVKLISGILLLAVFAEAQTCENYGFVNGSTCACPTGFGGATCNEPPCGGTIFDGTSRSLATVAVGSTFANMTASGCTCESGWTGTGCNVCLTANACQTAYTASGYSPSSADALANSENGLNDTMVCSNVAQVYSSSQMSCDVNNEMLQDLYPLASTLNIMRTLEPALTPIPNVTSFGSAGSVYAQLFYAGVEQFYCEADTCATTDDGTGASDWTCNNLQCTCRTDATFCGGVPAFNLTTTINTLSGTLDISCEAPDNTTNTATCAFKQSVLESVFGNSGLALAGCTFGECVKQSVIDQTSDTTTTSTSSGKPISGGVIAGLCVVCGLVFLAICTVVFGLIRQRKARNAIVGSEKMTDLGNGGVDLEWDNVSYMIPDKQGAAAFATGLVNGFRSGEREYQDKTVLDCVSGVVRAGQMMAILGPSGAGKTTLVEILARKNKSGVMTGSVSFTNPTRSQVNPSIGFVPQQDILPPTLTVHEALMFAARLRLPERVLDAEKSARVERLMDKLGISALRDTRIGYAGDVGGGKSRGISGGEMRRVSIGLELVASPDILILDEPTSGLDSVSASKVATVLHAIAHDPVNPTVVIASIHQPSSQLYQQFDSILLLSHGRALYSGPGCFAPAEHFERVGLVEPCPPGYNVADYLLEVATDPPVALFQLSASNTKVSSSGEGGCPVEALSKERGAGVSLDATERGVAYVDVPYTSEKQSGLWARARSAGPKDTCATTFLTQIQVLSGREWKILRRDKTLFFAHVFVSAILGVFCGGLYFQTGVTIAGFQSRVGCLFFLGALVAFSSLSALYNVVEIRPLFLRERSSSYYSPSAWLVSRFLFDVIPLRVIPTIVVSTITYWMTGLTADAAHFFKFLLILVLYTLAMTLYNFLLGALFHNGGIAILLSALSALYQMTFAGFFVHLNSIPPVLRWLQWLCPLKYNLEALATNEISSGLMIDDTLEGVTVQVSASLIMDVLFGFGDNNYYRDVLVLFGFIAGFGIGVIGVIWLKVRERR